MRVFKCNHCSRIHIEVGNTQIHFNSLSDMEKYLKNLDSIDAAYYAAVNRKMGLAKVIILPLDNIGNVHLGFTEQEFEELKCIIRSYISGGSRSQSETAALHNFGKRQKVCLN